MRKIYLMLIALLAAMMAGISVLPVGMPGEQAQPGIVRQGERTVLAAENRLFTSRIYTMEGERITGIYRESRYTDGKESAIVRIAGEGETLWFIRMLDNGPEWQLVELKQGQAGVLYQGSFPYDMTVTGLAVKGDTFWITGLGEELPILVYEYTVGMNQPDMKYVLPGWWAAEGVSAQFDGEKVRVTNKYDEHFYLSVQGSRTYTDEAEEPVLALPAVERAGEQWLLCKGPALIAGGILWLLMSLTVLIAAVLCRRSSRLAGRLTAVGSEAVLLALAVTLLAAFYVIRVNAGLVPAYRFLRGGAVAAAAIWLGSWLVLYLAAGYITKLIPKLTRQMNRVAEGQIDPEPVTSGTDELKVMDHSMQEMCMGLAIRDYELKATIRSYSRFVPQELTRLLERATVAEVELGDNIRMEGNVGLFSVGNRDQVRGTLEDEAFVDFLNQSFDMFHQCIHSNRGCMLSGSLSLSSMEALFDDPGDGVQAALDFLGQSQKPLKGIPAPKPFLMLHRASFLYGVAGWEERLYPYLSSAELEFLGGFAPAFQRAGVRIVVTEDYWKQLQASGFFGRYVGFVSDEERGMAYKLYEILNAYPELERELRIGYDARFQEAINLFYKNDFYLARNLFSNLLRACPTDGIVRWYLFACERFFNQESGQGEYSLFGIEE